MERLQKVIAAAGITSRRKAEVLISEGRVAVNGETITELGYKVKRGDLIEVDGKAIEKEDKVYFLMNKPKRTMCTSAMMNSEDRPWWIWWIAGSVFLPWDVWIMIPAG